MKIKFVTLNTVILLANCVFILYYLRNYGTEINTEPLDLRQVRPFINNVAPQNGNQRKKILLWNAYWGKSSQNWERIFFRYTVSECPINDCDLVYDHRHLKNADAVVFHAFDIHPDYDIPQRINSDQPWVFFAIEAPTATALANYNSTLDMEKLNNIFNWTMTYRRDSDIVIPYGRFYPEKNDTQIKNIWTEKRSDKFAVWMVSHCLTEGRREWFVVELMKYINIDIYGECGDKKCGERMTISKVELDFQHCFDMISTYFFYLAFENSICTDYITEKLYGTLKLNIIPVVFGGGDYLKMAPPNSVINALDFPNPKELAKHLHYVASNEQIYNSYFEWRKKYKVELGHPKLPLTCDLCAKLHGREVITKPIIIENEALSQGVNTTFKSKGNQNSYSDLRGWFVGGGACRKWTMKDLN